MIERIAWIRLITYFGSSLILLTEIYRLILLYLRFIILIPSLYSILEIVMLWCLFGGFLSLTTGFYGLKRSDPFLLDPDKYPISHLNKIIFIGIIIVCILMILNLLPPLHIVEDESLVLFQVIISFLWICYYSFIITWISLFWSFINDKNFREIINNRRMVLHICLGLIIILLKILDSLWMLFSENALLSFDLAYISYVFILVFFLLLQIVFFYRATRFSFIIHG